jgi:hypothetical protein
MPRSVLSLMLCVTVAVSAVPAVAQVSVKGQVYAALRSGAGYHGVPAARLLVKDEFIPIPMITGSAVAEWLKEINTVPAELREATRRPAVSKPSPVDRSLFPAGTQFISEAAIDAVFTQPLMKSWAAFKRQYKSEGWVSYSDVLVTSDSLDALVYTEAHCGSLCGEAGYIWLHRTAPAAPWSIMKSIATLIAIGRIPVADTRTGRLITNVPTLGPGAVYPRLSIDRGSLRTDPPSSAADSRQA